MNEKHASLRPTGVCCQPNQGKEKGSVKLFKCMRHTKLIKHWLFVPRYANRCICQAPANVPAFRTPVGCAPIRREESAQWRQLMRQHHYLGFERLVAQRCAMSVSRGIKVGRLARLGSAALKCAPRDQWIGGTGASIRRLQLIANNRAFFSSCPAAMNPTSLRLLA